MNETPITGQDLEAELRRMFNLIEAAQQSYKDAANEYASANHIYRKAKATAFLTVSSGVQRQGPSVDHIKAVVDQQCEHEREICYLAEAQKETAQQALYSLRAQLTALQSIAACVRSEAELGKGYQPKTNF